MIIDPNSPGNSRAAAPVTTTAHTVEVTAANLRQEVLEASRTQIVLLDFWAPWCEPCKALTPVLERVAAQSGGRVKLAKINVDQNQMVAAQFRVQSIPTVYAIYEGRPIDAFTGAQSEAQVKAFVTKLMSLLGAEPKSNDVQAVIEAANQALEAGALPQAAQLYAAVLAEMPEHIPALVGMARVLLAQGALPALQEFLLKLPAEALKDPGIVQIQAGIALSKEGLLAPDVPALEAAVAQNPQDHASRLSLARDALGRGDVQRCADHLLEIIARDAQWQDGLARQLLLKLFQSMGLDSAFTASNRRRLSAILYR
jgi:putative thioredoxin